MIIRSIGGMLVLASAFALGLTWYAEHILEYVPCELCLLERMPWRILLVLGVLALLIPGRIGFWSAVLSIPVLVIDIGLAILHGGVEHKWWQSPLPSCHAPRFHGGSFRERLLSMPMRPAKPCDDATYLFHLPISMSVLGGLFAFVLLVLISYGIWRERRS
ncbi:dihydrolipoamide acyltransferase [Kozakia baliensis]|nr:dihydrolipoamide acyltransferase [Kozakia baliensis]